MKNERAGPRERANEVGFDALADAELVALVLGTGAHGKPVAIVAEELLGDVGGVGGLAREASGALEARRGIGRAKGARLCAAIELGRRAYRALGVMPSRIDSADDVDVWARSRLAHLEHEELWLLALDGRNHLRASRRVAQGGLHGLAVRARDVIRIALRENACGFILVHNHPSGDATPSNEDNVFTTRVANAAAAVGTPLLDHVIVSRSGRAVVPLPPSLG